MAGLAMDESAVGRSSEGVSGGQQRCHSGEALAEWRSCEQVENGTPSTSLIYWDSDDDEDGGPKPSELYGKYTWKIDKFSQINKRELRSNAFEVGGYKWYAIRDQNCSTFNHKLFHLQDVQIPSIPYTIHAFDNICGKLVSL